MEVGNGSEDHRGRLLAELVRTLELARQMEAESNQHLKNEQAGKLVLQELLATIEKSIFLAKSSDPAFPEVGGDTPRFPADGSEPVFKDRLPKKRKMLPKWRKEVRVDSSAGGVEFVPIDDGQSWRKYGQKDILGAKHPRGYYRCTHQMTQGCPATKQVQRSDKDPLLFHVVYHGAHTCLQGPGQQKLRASRPARLTQEQQQEMKPQGRDLLLSFQTGLRVKTEELELRAPQAPITSLSSSSSSSSSFSFLSPATPDAITRSSPTFVSPTGSDSAYFSLCSPERGAAAGGADLAAATTISSYYLDMDFMTEFEQDFFSLFPLEN